ncbi:MAG: DUF1761 domain-containing protein [Saprospiraceae bacterium]|nr:DUF1761 domain-containing protein [Saprospiraceae bacterium]
MNQYLAIFIGGLIPMILGFIWYHPKVFGGAWMKSLGFTEESLKEGNMGLTMGLATLLAMVLSWKLNEWSSHVEPGMSQFVHGFYHGAMGLGLPAALVLVSNSLFQRNTWTNILINAIYWVIALGLMGAFLYSVATPEAAPAVQ